MKRIVLRAGHNNGKKLPRQILRNFDGSVKAGTKFNKRCTFSKTFSRKQSSKTEAKFLFIYCFSEFVGLHTIVTAQRSTEHLAGMAGCMDGCRSGWGCIQFSCSFCSVCCFLVHFSRHLTIIVNNISTFVQWCLKPPILNPYPTILSEIKTYSVGTCIRGIDTTVLRCALLRTDAI